MPNLEENLSAIQKAEDAETVFQMFANAGRGYGFDNACFTLLDDHAREGLSSYHGFATDYPEDWLTYYRSREYFDIDPVIYQASRGSRPFLWSEAVDAQCQDMALLDEDKQASCILMQEASDAGLADGLGVPLFTVEGALSAVGFSTNERDKDLPRQALAEISLLASVFHERYLSFYKNDAAIRITARETDVLSWSAEGKTDSEIALLLGVTPATVRFHWANIFRKLDAVNKVNATAKAIRLKLVSVSLIGVPEVLK